MTLIDLTDRRRESEERSHQEKLALSLIQSLGFDGAIHACQANSWDGVLRCILSFRGAGEEMAH